jgi:hypothetical protein
MTYTYIYVHNTIENSHALHIQKLILTAEFIESYGFRRRKWF